MSKLESEQVSKLVQCDRLQPSQKYLVITLVKIHSMSWERWQTRNQIWTFVYFYQKNYQGLFRKCQRRNVNEHQKLKIHEKLQKLSNEKTVFYPIFNHLYLKTWKFLVLSQTYYQKIKSINFWPNFFFECFWGSKCIKMAFLSIFYHFDPQKYCPIFFDQKLIDFIFWLYVWLETKQFQASTYKGLKMGKKTKYSLFKFWSFSCIFNFWGSFTFLLWHFENKPW